MDPELCSTCAYALRCLAGDVVWLYCPHCESRFSFLRHDYVGTDGDHHCWSENLTPSVRCRVAAAKSLLFTCPVCGYDPQ
jgi:predicted RNA-binding Zn-ribbon protein involved in translation (DUF1610 family)